MKLPTEEELWLLDFGDSTGTQECLALLAEMSEVWYGIVGSYYVWLPKEKANYFTAKLRAKGALFIERICRNPAMLPVGKTIEIQPQRGKCQRSYLQ